MDKFVIKQSKNSDDHKLKQREVKCRKDHQVVDLRDESPRKKLKSRTEGSEEKEPPPLLSEQESVRDVEYSWKRLRTEGLNCDYTKIFSKPEADDIFLQLEKVLEYFSGEQTKVQVFGKWHNIPRKQVTYGDLGLTYTYSGVTLAPKPWLPVLEMIRDRVTQATGHTFNFVLINRYKDGSDHMGEHRDDEKELEPLSPIASVSFGACRDFIFRHRDSRGKSATRHLEPVKLLLGHGSLLMMNYPTNIHWYHSLPVRKKVLMPRVNLTFRKVQPPLKN
ncbi:DNA oxidative demethylase ALKBH2 [Carcharodon carcharias]|uniref:DNA oxidative demethylase ALKBH2 n=1 Tax=Carcharodon carcharias TaxID=13397 RepID=UPI001B7E1818|nr:DNA oxidative demethylase ALKBH2 [Carcharodon carcharias]XP_041058003.1 DNA oxidative demethylase ALKBH2 [Carcharodon carcharias]